MDLDKVIDARQSIRKFKNKKPDWRDVIKAVDFARKIPLAGNINNLKYILIDNEEKIDKLADYSEQAFISKAKYVVVVVSDDARLTKSYDGKGKWYSHQQAGASINQFLLKLVDLGLSGCWIGAYNEDKVKTLLKIKDKAVVEAIIPIGYAHESPKKKRKSALDSVLRFNDYEERYMKPRKKPEAF